MNKSNYVIRVYDSPLHIGIDAWNALLARQTHPTPFMRLEFLVALHRSASATPATGWTPRFATLWDSAGMLHAACPLYFKDHSRGEYVFDWSWAEAHHRHGMAYYPKAVVAVPFTPVPGNRLLAADEPARTALLDVVLALCREADVSSLHVLFGHAQDIQACIRAGMMERQTVQFHWTSPSGITATYRDFDDFLAALNQEKRKKIRQERRKVREAGVTLRHSRGSAISEADWDFFFQCYERTYLEHGNLPYLKRDFFTEVAQTLSQNWLLFVAERAGHPVASSLIAVSGEGPEKVAWGRYWGTLERIDCLHFEACYYSPLQWCIEHGYHRFEGGAQGEHKLARALLPVRTASAHWLAHPEFSVAVQNFLDREGRGINDYVEELERHVPLRQSD